MTPQKSAPWAPYMDEAQRRIEAARAKYGDTGARCEAAAETPPAEKSADQKAVDALGVKIEGVAKDLKAAIDKRDTEARELGGAQEKTAATVEEHVKLLKELQDEREEKFKEWDSRLKEIESKAGMPGVPGDPEPSPAEQFTASEAYKRVVQGNLSKSDPVKIKGNLLGALRRKALITTGDATRLTLPQRDPLIAPAQRAARIRDLMPVRQTGSNSGEYIEETGFNDASTTAVSGITRTGQVATATVASTAGMGAVGQTIWITVSGAVQTEYNITARALIASATTLTYTVAGTPATPATGTIVLYVRQTHGAAAPVAEGAVKPEARIQFELRTWLVQTIAHWIPMTRQVRDDAPQLQSYIEDRLLYGLEFTEEQELLYGDGSAPSLQGILTHANRQIYLWSSGEALPVPDTKIDAIRRAMTLAQLDEYTPSGLVVHPFDWEDVELAKGTQGHYLTIASIDNAGVTRFFRLPVVVTSAIRAGTALVGAFSMGGTIWDREDSNIRISDQHEDFFIRNQLLLLAEERLGVAWYRPNAFVEVSFDAAPS